MHRLHKTNDFTKWENAVKWEWAIVHAKFYVSLADKVHRQQRRNPSTNHSQNQRGQRHRGSEQNIRKKERLPDQSLVIDVKAVEKATLGTDFRAVPGSSGIINHSQRQPVGRSKVRMKRIPGLTDDDDWKSGPLFECKLYYRAEEVISGPTTTNDDDADSIEMESEQEGDAMSQNSNSDDGSNWLTYGTYML